MPRRKNMYVAEHADRAGRELRKRFRDLDKAIAAWSDGGRLEDVEIALDALQMDQTVFEPIQLTDRATYQEVVQARAVEFVMASQFSRRIEAAASAATHKMDQARDELFAAIVDRPAIAGYAEAFLRRLQAEGIGQTDLHPASKALAREVARAIRAYNDGRRATDESSDDQFEEPLSSWSELPRQFSGFEITEMDEAEYPFPPYPLPPSTDIAAYTIDRHAPMSGRSRLATYRAWGAQIMKWAEMEDERVDLKLAAIWAVLLAHRLDEDDSDVSPFYGQVVVSPWTPGKVARIGPAAKP